jgi:hypothetical protein
MNYKEREKAAQKGIEILKTNTFPNELLQNIKDKRVRVDLSDKIFYPKDGPKHDELSPEEKKDRAKRLIVELAFIKKMSALDSFRKSAYILAITGLIMLVLSVANNNGNLAIALITTASSAVLYGFGMKNEYILKHASTILLAFVCLFAIEMAIFKVPNPALSNMSNDVLASRRGALLQIVNLMSPYLYLVTKVLVIGILFYTKTAIVNLGEIKRTFESQADNKG